MVRRMQTAIAVCTLAVAAAITLSCTERINSPVTNGQGGTTRFTVRNNSSFTFDTVYFSLSTDPTWGQNRSTLAPGQAVVISATPASWALKVVINGPPSYEYSDYYIDVAAGSDSICLADSNFIGGTLKYANQTACTMYRIARRVSGHAAWSPNLLSPDSMPSSNSTLYYYIPPETYDLRVENSDGHVWAETLGVVLGQQQEFDWTIKTRALQSDTYGMVEIVNGSTNSISIYSLYQRPYVGMAWGSIVVYDSPVYSGDSAYVLALTPGTYDLRATSIGGTYFAETTGVHIAVGTTVRWVVSLLDSAPILAKPVLRVYNNSTETVSYLYYRANGTATWGPDLLGASTLSAGDTLVDSSLSAGLYDLHAVGSNARYSDTIGIRLSSSTAAVWKISSLQDTGTAAAVSLKVYNNSSFAIESLWVARSTDVSWNSSWLTAQLSAGGTFVVTPLDTGLWDIDAETATHTYIKFRKPLVAGTNTLALADSDFVSGVLQIYNYSSYGKSATFSRLLRRATGSYSWTVDTLVADYTYTGEYIRDWSIPEGTWDFIFEAENGTQFAETTGVDIPADSYAYWYIYDARDTTYGSLPKIGR
jgi:hypothetical protein